MGLTLWEVWIGWQPKMLKNSKVQMRAPSYLPSAAARELCTSITSIDISPSQYRGGAGIGEGHLLGAGLGAGGGGLRKQQ